MWPITARAAAQLAVNHRPYLAADILGPGGTIIAAGLCLETATLTIDGSSAVRRTVDFEIANPDQILPLTATGLLSPFGNELVVYGGVWFDDGTFERWPVGVFGLDDPHAVNNGELRVTGKGFDRAASVQARTSTDPGQISAGMQIEDAVAFVVNLARPGLTMVFQQTGFVADTVTWDVGADLWAVAANIAATGGCDLFFDQAGNLVLESSSVASTAGPVWSYDSCGPLLTGVDLTLTARNAYSHVIGVGTALDGSTPLRADAFDTDPSSPTFAYGPFGVRTLKFEAHSTNQALLDLATRAKLRKVRGASQVVAITGVPMSAHDAGDVVVITDCDTHVAGDYTIDKVTVPLHARDSGDAQITCRPSRAA